MSSRPPRLVIVTRQTELEALLSEHATRGQAEFYLKSRGQSLDGVLARHDMQKQAEAYVLAHAPEDWPRVDVDRDRLDRFNFAPNDIAIAIGQDGLVANLAKYLNGQTVLGISPNPETSEGVLTPFSVQDGTAALVALSHADMRLQKRTMLKAVLDNGESLLSLNEVFIGHQSHQSARYILRARDAEEFQSSSGIIVATGTGFTGWAKSILAATGLNVSIAPDEAKAHFFSREPWPSRHSGAELRHGAISGQSALKVTSRMNTGGVIFADGIEKDFLDFNWGRNVEIQIAPQSLNLAVPD